MLPSISCIGSEQEIVNRHAFQVLPEGNCRMGLGFIYPNTILGSFSNIFKCQGRLWRCRNASHAFHSVRISPRLYRPSEIFMCCPNVCFGKKHLLLLIKYLVGSTFGSILLQRRMCSRTFPCLKVLRSLEEIILKMKIAKSHPSLLKLIFLFSVIRMVYFKN